MTTTILAHFDGQVIVPEEPLPLAPREKVRVTIERESHAQQPPPRRQAGSARGQVWMSPDFDAPLPENLLAPVIVGLDGSLSKAIASDPEFHAENMYT